MDENNDTIDADDPAHNNTTWIDEALDDEVFLDDEFGAEPVIEFEGEPD